MGCGCNKKSVKKNSSAVIPKISQSNNNNNLNSINSLSVVNDDGNYSGLSKSRKEIERKRREAIRKRLGKG